MKGRRTERSQDDQEGDEREQEGIQSHVPGDSTLRHPDDQADPEREDNGLMVSYPLEVVECSAKSPAS